MHSTSVRIDGATHVDLGVPRGREAGLVHPAVVLTAQRVLERGPSVVQVAPITSTRRGFESEIEVVNDAANGLGRPWAIQCQHVRAVSTERVIAVRGNVGSLVLAQARDSVAVLLDLPVS